MSSPTYPFPLAVHSSHHSHYHRFLLGASASVLAPFPRPDCLGALAAEMPDLTKELTLAKWRTLYHGAVPWVPGFAPHHYRTGQVPAHRPLPESYGRPTRKFGAYDLVQIADPSVSALALVAGDARVLAGFLQLNGEFCGRLETHVAAYQTGPDGSRVAGRCALGRFAEPNNRWQMPFLHVHTRVLNFTSFRETPRELLCLDPATLAQGCRRANAGSLERQAGQLEALGYRVELPRDGRDGLRVGGVSEPLLAAMAAPRTALLRLLHRLVGPAGHPERAASGTEREAAALAAMADRLEERVVDSRSFYRPPKVSLPCEGPWREAVGTHLRALCPADYAALTAAATAARAKGATESFGGRDCGTAWTAFPVPATDRGHRHRPSTDELAARDQEARDCELGGDLPLPARLPAPSPWLVRQFEDELSAVRRELSHGPRPGPDAALPWRRAAARLDALPEGPDLAQLQAAEDILEAGLVRHSGRPPELPNRSTSPLRPAPERTIEFGSLDEMIARSRSFAGPHLPERGGISR
jgi:hypothetical protein